MVEGGREGGSDGGKKGAREGGRKEGGSDGGREGAREGGREGRRGEMEGDRKLPPPLPYTRRSSHPSSPLLPLPYLRVVRWVELDNPINLRYVEATSSHVRTYQCPLRRRTELEES